MGGRKEGTPECQRHQRPLSIIQENSDEETPVLYKEEITLRHSTDIINCNSDNKEEISDNCIVKKTRRKAIISQQHPVFALAEQNGNSELIDKQSANFETEITPSAESEGDFLRLKDTAKKLNLKTRRQSYLTWRAKYVDKISGPPEVTISSEGDDLLTPERKERMNNAIQWIRNELIDLRRQDQSLARQLLGIRHDLSRLRLSVSCEEHQNLLEEAQDQMEELRELSRFVDFPTDILDGPTPLRQIGVTKMNLSSRRFSTC